ncbi:MAG: pantoate--beta-alanine ligase [Pseudomonadota bacterium]
MAIADPKKQLRLARTLVDLRETVAKWRADGETIGFVPTMGALHAGHLSLVEAAARAADRVVVSIFVNPSQFAPHEDFDAYPRTEETDLAALHASACALAYLPDVSTIYPEGFQTSINVSEISKGLCGATRPHFFGGVATVVCKLLNQCAPDVAVFGEKDFQQLLVIRRMARDLDLPVEILGAPIVREDDGLALSSRNAYLGEKDRAIAGQLNMILAHTAEMILSGDDVATVLNEARTTLLNAGVEAVDYLELRRNDDLTPVSARPQKGEARLFLAAYVGGVRLIDNWPVERL